MLFRASEHSFRSDAFHYKCDNRQDTLVLIRTEFGKTIGGFTHYPWNSSGEWLHDSNCKAFIFSLDMKKKFVANSGRYLIYSKSCYGPVFGGGFDICISNGCDSNRNSSAYFPCTFNSLGAKRLVNSEETWSMFSGDKNFRIEEYEVFQLFFE